MSSSTLKRVVGIMWKKFCCLPDSLFLRNIVDNLNTESAGIREEFLTATNNKQEVKWPFLQLLVFSKN
jgi:hypothetical protein